ncbi:MAG TPA: hypothetical protein VEA44_15710 [Caulobacter sp.]|nr:hypothetical protein [Caulobacter sp.]
MHPTHRAAGVMALVLLALGGLAAAAQGPASQPVTPAEARRLQQKERLRPGSTTAPTADQGVTSPTHQAHVGRIVFTRADQQLAQVDAGAFVSDFAIGDPFYFRVFLARSAVNAMKPLVPNLNRTDAARSMRYRVRFTVGGQTVEARFNRWGRDTEHLEWTTWRGAFLARQETTIPGQEVFREFLSRATARGLLPPGRHRVAVEVVPVVEHSSAAPVVGQPIARGEFNLTVTPASFNRRDPKVCMMQPGMSDPALENEMLKLARSQWNTAENQPQRPIIVDGGWTIERHPVSGVVVSRSINAIIPAKGAEACNYRGYAYRQQYVGGRFLPASSFAGAQRDVTFAPCPCIP